MNKRGLSEIVTISIMLGIMVVLVIVLYGFINPLVKESGKKIDVRASRPSLYIDNSFVRVNKDIGKLEFSVENIIGQNENISYLKVIVVSQKPVSYKIIDFPKSLEKKTYVLDISGVDINEFVVYPVYNDDVIGYANRYSLTFEENDSIDLSKEVISQLNEDNEKCTPEFDCLSWSNCYTIYGLNELIDRQVILNAMQSRECVDKNHCIKNSIEYKFCEDKRTVMVKRTVANGKDYIEVYDNDYKLISKMEYIPGNVDKLNIELPLI